MAFPCRSQKSHDPNFLKPFKPEEFGDNQVHVSRGADCGFLFRIERPPGGRVVILVQSAVKPDWGYAFHNAGHLLAAADVRPFDPCFVAGQRLRFRLRANPTVKRVFQKTQPGEGKPVGKRVGVSGEEAQRAWLESRSQASGFRLVDFRVNSRADIQSTKLSTGMKMKHLSVDYEGVLAVTDPDLFAKTLGSGIGSAKGFGFGLLSVAPLR
jgi:CRISPR system Cascade subunit CasE